MDALLNFIPAYASDLRANLGSVLQQHELTEQQTWSVALASAIASRGPKVLDAIAAEAAKRLSEAAANAAKAAAAVMGANNILYRFRHTAGNPKYHEIPARLRMLAIKNHGGDPADFHLCCVAVSAINFCQVCVDSHEKSAREVGLTEEQVFAAVRIASVLFSLAAIMEAESAMNPRTAAGRSLAGA